MKNRKIIVLMVLISVMTFAFTPAVNAAFSIPSNGLLVDSSDTTVRASAMRAGQVAPMILGANLVATSNLGALQDANTQNPNSLLGVFGSNANSNPDPYLYNYFYNTGYAEERNLTLIKEATSAVQQLDGTGQAPDVILEALTNRPHLILSQAEGVGSSNPNVSYAAVIQTLPENTDGDPANDYNPSYFTCSTSSLVYQTENLKNLAAAMLDIMQSQNLTARYGDPVVVAADYDKYIWGAYFYVARQIESGQIAKKSVAVVSGTEDNGAVWNMPQRAVSVSQGRPNRLVEYCRDNTDLLSDTVGASATLEQVLGCDVVIAVGNGDTLRNAAEAAGIEENELPVIFDSLPNCLYGMVMQTHENALGIPYLQSFIYADALDLNPVYAAAYFYQKFFHITDDSALQETVAVLLSNASLPGEAIADLSGYDPLAYEALLTEGIQYALDIGGHRHDDPDPWQPNMSVGIGTGVSSDGSYTSAPNQTYTPGASGSVPGGGGGGGGGGDGTSPSAPTADGGVPAADSSAPAAETWVNPFSDVSPSDWFYGDVAYAATHSLFGGTSSSTFAPQIPMTRGMLVTVLGRLHKANVSSYTSGGAFADVLASQYYAPYVEWARANHLAVGVGQNLFLPDQEISRQDMAVILKRYADFTGKRLAETRLIATFADETDIADYAKPSVALLYRAGILGGVGDNQINPRGSVTRAEAAALLRRFIESV